MANIANSATVSNSKSHLISWPSTAGWCSSTAVAITSSPLTPVSSPNQARRHPVSAISGQARQRATNGGSRCWACLQSTWTHKPDSTYTPARQSTRTNRTKHLLGYPRNNRKTLTTGRREELGFYLGG